MYFLASHLCVHCFAFVTYFHIDLSIKVEKMHLLSVGGLSCYQEKSKSIKGPLCKAAYHTVVHRDTVVYSRQHSNGDASLGNVSYSKGCSSRAAKQDVVADCLAAFICLDFH